jgi:hypothetical protein
LSAASSALEYGKRPTRRGFPVPAACGAKAGSDLNFPKKNQKFLKKYGKIYLLFTKNLVHSSMERVFIIFGPMRAARGQKEA